MLVFSAPRSTDKDTFQRDTMNTVQLSFEFFPPRFDGTTDNLVKYYKELASLKPKYVSVTFGAGGSTQLGTLGAVKALQAAGANAAPHLTCIGTSKAYVKEIMADYLAIGVDRVVALRGDYPSGMVSKGEFNYAVDLVRFLRSEYGQDLTIEVAAYPEFHPESVSPSQEIKHFKEKIDAGANAAITQYFFNADSYFAYMDDLNRAGVIAPVVPGIMPIDNVAGLRKFSGMCGAEIPKWICNRLNQYENDPESLRSFGLDVVSHLCLDLIENGVDGLHFYTLNKSALVKQICANISGSHQQ